MRGKDARLFPGRVLHPWGRPRPNGKGSIDRIYTELPRPLFSFFQLTSLAWRRRFNSLAGISVDGFTPRDSQHWDGLEKSAGLPPVVRLQSVAVGVFTFRSNDGCSHASQEVPSCLTVLLLDLRVFGACFERSECRVGRDC